MAQFPIVELRDLHRYHIFFFKLLFIKGFSLTHSSNNPSLSQPYSTGDDSTMSPPTCGSRPIVQQQRIWRLYRIITENFSEWKCMAFTKVLLGALTWGRSQPGKVGGCQSDSELFSLQFSLSMAREKTDAWLTEAARLSTTLGLHSPVIQRCMRLLEEFRNYLPLLNKLGTLQLQNFNCQSLLRSMFG